MSDRPTKTSEIEITPAMIAIGGRCLRAYLPEVSFGESENLAERVLRAALSGTLLFGPPTAHDPSEIF
jgi:hypothetical protein